MLASLIVMEERLSARCYFAVLLAALHYQLLSLCLSFYHYHQLLILPIAIAVGTEFTTGFLSVIPLIFVLFDFIYLVKKLA